MKKSNAVKLTDLTCSYNSSNYFNAYHTADWAQLQHGCCKCSGHMDERLLCWVLGNGPKVRRHTALVRNNNFPTVGQRKTQQIHTHTHTHTLFSPGAWRSYVEDVARWATEMASVQHFGSEPRWPAAKERERYRGKRGRERWREGGERERAVSINTHQSDGSMRYLTMQANPPSGQPRRGGVLVVGGLVSDHEWVSEFQHPPQTTPTLPPSKPAESSKC